MRIRALFPCCLLAATALLATVADSSAETCSAGNFTVSTTGPTQCLGDSNCTQITYTVTGGKPDHIATVVGSAGTDCSGSSIISVTGGKPSGNQWYPAGVGDPLTRLGKHACHEEAAKINPHGTVTEFTIKVAGARSAAPKSVVTKKGHATRSCEIVGIGEGGDAQVASVTETLTHGACSVVFTLNAVTGAVMNAELTEESEEAGCDFIVDDVANLELKLGGQSLGIAQFGNGGYIQTGTLSCTTRIVGGRVYSWGSPCP